MTSVAADSRAATSTTSLAAGLVGPWMLTAPNVGAAMPVITANGAAVADADVDAALLDGLVVQHGRPCDLTAGELVISGHRNSGPHLLRNVQHVAVGDVLTFAGSNGSCAFRVTSAEVLPLASADTAANTGLAVPGSLLILTCGWANDGKGHKRGDAGGIDGRWFIRASIWSGPGR